MIDDFLKLLSGMMQQSGAPMRPVNTENLKTCINLVSDGWSVKQYASITDSFKLKAIFCKGDLQQEIILNLAEQKMWNAFLKHKKETDLKNRSL